MAHEDELQAEIQWDMQIHELQDIINGHRILLDDIKSAVGAKRFTDQELLARLKSLYSQAQAFAA